MNNAKTEPKPFTVEILTPAAAVILPALHAVMGKCGYVQKKGENTFQKYKYAGEGNLLEVLRPAMVEAGLLLIPSGKSRSAIDEHGITHVEIEYTLAHKSGAVWPEKIVAFGDGGDKNSKGVGDKGLYKALTGANKYLLFKLFQIETGDDPENDTEHDKEDTAKPPANDASKSAPGISAAQTWVREAVRELNGCADSDQLMTYIETDDFKKRATKIAAVYPNVWQGPEEFSGLRGTLKEIGNAMQVAPGMGNYIRKIELAAKEHNNLEAA